MIRKLRFITLAFFIAVPAFTQTVIWEEDFETDGNGSRYTVSNEFFDSEDDYFGRIHGPTLEYGFGGAGSNFEITLTGTGFPAGSNQIGNYSNYNGSYYMAGEDQDDADGVGGTGVGDGLDEKTVTFTVDISTGQTLTFKGLFGAANENGCTMNNYDAADYIRVSYNVDGAGDVLALQFSPDIECNIPGDTSNEPMHFDPNMDGDGGEGALMSGAMQEFSFPFPDGNSVVISVETHSDAGEEELAFDYFRIEALNVLGVTEHDYLSYITISPNPSNGIIKLKKPFGLELQQAVIYSVLGRQVKSVNLESMGASNSIDLSVLSSGMYLMNIQTLNGSTITKKIIIQ